MAGGSIVRTEAKLGIWRGGAGDGGEETEEGEISGLDQRKNFHCKTNTNSKLQRHSFQQTPAPNTYVVVSVCFEPV